MGLGFRGLGSRVYSILGYIVLYRDNGKMETTIVYLGYTGLYRDNGKDSGNYYLGFRA